MQVSKPFNRLDYIFKVFVILGIGTAAIILTKDIIIPLAFASDLNRLPSP